VRRILQAQDAELIHLGHDRSVDEVAVAAVQEDVDAVAISGVRHADGFPLEFGTISVSDGISIICRRMECSRSDEMFQTVKGGPPRRFPKPT
jgi:hypothetical protein